MAEETKQEETIEESQSRLEGYRKEIETLKVKVSELSTEVKKEFEAQLGELETLYKEAQKRYEELLNKTGDKLDEARAFMELTYKALIHSYRYFLSHYRKNN